jgi:hypothetical protein
MSIPRYTQLLASLINPTNNIFYKIQWVCYKNFVGWVKKRCQLLGIPRYTYAEKQTQCLLNEKIKKMPRWRPEWYSGYRYRL